MRTCLTLRKVVTLGCLLSGCTAPIGDGNEPLTNQGRMDGSAPYEPEDDAGGADAQDAEEDAQAAPAEDAAIDAGAPDGQLEQPEDSGAVMPPVTRSDAGAVLPDAGVDRPDAGLSDADTPMPDASTPKPDAGTPKPDAGTPKPDAGTPKPDAGTPKPDAGTPKPDAGTPKPDAGTPKPDAGTPDAGAPSVKFKQVYAIIAERCAFCHVKDRIGFQLGHLDMSSAHAAHRNLVGETAAGIDCGGTGHVRVVAGKPEESLIIHKLEGTADCGVRMPDGLPPLSPEQIHLIRSWIRAGAKND
jgi:hypothetical protein